MYINITEVPEINKVVFFSFLRRKHRRFFLKETNLPLLRIAAHTVSTPVYKKTSEIAISC